MKKGRVKCQTDNVML